MGPVFEDRLVGRLQLNEVGAAIGGNSGMKDVVVAALDDVDGVDLHIAKLGDGRECSVGALAEGFEPVEPLRRDPDVARAGLLKRARG